MPHSEGSVDRLIGLVVVAVGATVAWHAYRSYPVGTLARMGTGMVPLLLGGFLSVIGAAMVVGPVPATEARDTIAWRSVASLAAALVSAGVMMPRFGLVPTALLFSVLCCRASREMSPRLEVAMVAMLTILFTGLFHFFIGLSIPLFRWAP